VSVSVIGARGADGLRLTNVSDVFIPDASKGVVRFPKLFRRSIFTFSPHRRSTALHQLHSSRGWGAALWSPTVSPTVPPTVPPTNSPTVSPTVPPTVSPRVARVASPR